MMMRLLGQFRTPTKRLPKGRHQRWLALYFLKRAIYSKHLAGQLVTFFASRT